MTSTSGSQHTVSDEEGGGRNPDATRLEKLESHVAHLEQTTRSLLGQVAITTVAADSGRDREEHSFKEELARVCSEIQSRLEKIEHRVSLNEYSMRAEEARVTTLVKSTQEIERGILDGQRQLLERREEQGARLEGVKESVHQLEQRQLQLAEFGQQTQASLAAEVGRQSEEVRRVRGHVENVRGSVGGKLKELEREQRVLASLSTHVHVAYLIYMYMYMYM